MVEMNCDQCGHSADEHNMEYAHGKDWIMPCGHIEKDFYDMGEFNVIYCKCTGFTKTGVTYFNSPLPIYYECIQKKQVGHKA